MIVHIPSPLHSYTDGKTPVEATGKTLMDLLKNLDKQFPGFLFRVIDEQGEIREHMQFYLGTKIERDLSATLDKVSEVHVICAISGG